jgi:Histidine kinase-, DNA gyrase B-, and HSP90-like ATPase.
VDLMMEEVEKAINLTNGFMRINRFSGDDIRWADVVDILTNLTKKLTIILNGEHIIKTCFKDIKKAMIDPGVLQRVCLNLLQNAIEAMNKTGIIYIYTDELTNGMIRIRIADNGCGIPKDIKDKIFLPNFTTKARGTGYGLAITDALLRKYNCKIRVRSKVGRGSIFTVLLPPED